MSYYATGSGTVTIINGEIADALKVFLEEKYGKNGAHCSLDYDFYENNGTYYMDIYDSEKYHEADTTDLLELIAPYISEGQLEYSGEEDCIWKFVFDPKTQKWNEKYATISYGFDAYDDEELIAELEKRGYSVTKA